MAQYRILVIDDARVIRLSVKTIFEKLGVEVLELDSVEGLFDEVWKYHRADLIFLDIDLPGMDGLTALDKIRQDKIFARIPIIMLTGNAEPQIVKKAISAGIIDYVRKPFTSESLLRRVRPLFNLSDAPADSSPDVTLEPAAVEAPAIKTYYASIVLSSTIDKPAEIFHLLQPSPDSGLQFATTATLILPFFFAGTESEALQAMQDHLEQHDWPVVTCQVTTASPLSE